MRFVYGKVNYRNLGRIKRRSIAGFNTKHIFEVCFERPCFGFREGRFFGSYPEVASVVGFGNDIGSLFGIGTYRAGTFMKMTECFFQQVQWYCHNEAKVVIINEQIQCIFLLILFRAVSLLIKCGIKASLKVLNLVSFPHW